MIAETGHEGAPGRPRSLATPEVAAPVWRCGRFRLTLDRPRVMGILNLTEDSFSDGGRHPTTEAALAAADRMIADGADLIDIGAESTRPGAAPVSPALEWSRLAPVLSALAPRGCPISVDTRRPSVMTKAIAAGASIINDVGGFADPAAIAAVAGTEVGLVIMHMQGEPGTMQQAPAYDDVVADVASFLGARCAALTAAGVDAGRLCIDPGFGFGKTLDHNLALLRAIGRLAGVAPVLAGLSRKSMLGQLTGRAVGDRLAASIAAALAAVSRGAAVVRVHDVADTVAALAVWRAAGPAAAGPASAAGPERRVDRS